MPDSGLDAGDTAVNKKNDYPCAADTLMEKGSKLSKIHNTLLGKKGAYTIYVWNQEMEKR